MLTIHTAQYRYNGPDRIDITIKGATAPWSCFAPTWDMVMEYKKTGDKEVYIAQYNAIIQKVMVGRYKSVQALLNQDRTITLVCFCRPGEFCHRVLLAKHLESLGAVYAGELTT